MKKWSICLYNICPVCCENGGRPVHISDGMHEPAGTPSKSGGRPRSQCNCRGGLNSLNQRQSTATIHRADRARREYSWRSDCMSAMAARSSSLRTRASFAHQFQQVQVWRPILQRWSNWPKYAARLAVVGCDGAIVVEGQARLLLASPSSRLDCQVNTKVILLCRMFQTHQLNQAFFEQ